LSIISGLALFTVQAYSQGIKYQAGELEIRLSSDVEAAIDNGVPLTFVCEYAMLKKRFFVNWKAHYNRHDFVVTHHALTDSYLVSSQPGAAPRIFRSITETMGFVAQQAKNIFSTYNSADTPYQMRVRLSKTELPSPIRFNAFIATDWDLNTGWNSWQSAR